MRESTLESGPKEVTQEEAEEADVISGEELPAQVPTPEEAPEVPWEQPEIPWDDAPIGFTTNTKEA